VFKKVYTAAWLALLLACCQMAAAATLSVSATPANPAAPATITLSITLADNPEGAVITQVEYFNGSSSLGVAGSAPFQLNLTDVAAGSYAIVARATLDSVDQPLLVSDALAVTVNAAPGAAGVYYIHTDQLNTPRAITNGAGALVWLWNSDPFGAAAPAEQPAGQAPFVNNLRFAGQYYDRETNLHYNYFRDYDPQLGRYVQSDPIGLAGGINTYGYVAANPLKYSDPTGQCIEDFCIGETIAAASWCAANPACATGVVTLVGGGVYESTIKPPRVNDPEAAAAHQVYKDAYRQPPPPNMDECERLQWQLKREQDLLAARMAWDAKWGSHHADAIAQSQRAINNLQEKLKKAGCKCP
jgi:RHS repeat-associated protein